MKRLQVWFWEQWYLTAAIYELLSLRSRCLLWLSVAFVFVAAFLEYVVLREAGLLGTFALTAMVLFGLTVFSVWWDKKHMIY